jgi:hypothetical protein
LATVGPICGKPPDAHVRVESKVHTGFGSPEVTIRSSTAESAGGGRRRSFSETIRGNKGKLPGPFVRQGGGDGDEVPEGVVDYTRRGGCGELIMVGVEISTSARWEGKRTCRPGCVSRV